jgi:5-methylcytosine-specific restriction endonuclease McrA
MSYWSREQHKTVKHRNISPGLKDSCFQRDGFRCVLCGAGQTLLMAHKVSVRDDYDIRNNLDNVVTLCRRCEDTYGGRYYHYLDKFSEPLITKMLRERTETHE